MAVFTLLDALEAARMPQELTDVEARPTFSSRYSVGGPRSIAGVKRRLAGGGCHNNGEAANTAWGLQVNGASLGKPAEVGLHGWPSRSFRGKGVNGDLRGRSRLSTARDCCFEG